MSRYARLKRASKNNGGKKQFVDNQKRVVRGVLLLIISTLMIVFVFGDHGIFQLYKLKKERENIQMHITIVAFYILIWEIIIWQYQIFQKQ